MKTIFKVGQKVYDQVHYPDYEGKVFKVYDDSILVLFDGVENYYSLDGRSGDSLPTLSTKPYRVEFPGFEQREPTTTYDILRAEALKKGSYVSILNGIGLPNEKIAEAFEALAKLIWLRDYYNQGWKPDWGHKTQECKFCIVVYGNRLNKDTSYSVSKVLFFKTEEIRDKFLDDQKELLEIAKPLL